MKTRIQERRGGVASVPEDRDGAPLPVIGRFLDEKNGDQRMSEQKTGGSDAVAAQAEELPLIALFCFEPADSFTGNQVSDLCRVLDGQGRRVHLFSRTPFALDLPRFKNHVVEIPESTDLVEQASSFGSRASNAFLQQLGGASSAGPGFQPWVAAFEWTAGSVLSLLAGLRNLHGVLSLNSLEQQRSDLTSEISRQIREFEGEAIASAAVLFVHDAATAEVARLAYPAVTDRIVQAHKPFPIRSFEGNLDPGAIKARYQVGPIDPVILYVGDLDERYGPELALKAMPALLRHHPQAHLVIVGDGQMFWPLKVYARYLLLENAVRLIGHLQDEPLFELIQAADLIVVPSREATPWWPIQAAWAARKPVVATHMAARGLTEHEKDSVLIYPSENSVVWGVERVLYDADLRKNIGLAGRKKLEERYGPSALAEQFTQLLAACATR